MKYQNQPLPDVIQALRTESQEHSWSLTRQRSSGTLGRDHFFLPSFL